MWEFFIVFAIFIFVVSLFAKPKSTDTYEERLRKYERIQKEEERIQRRQKEEEEKKQQALLNHKIKRNSFLENCGMQCTKMYTYNSSIYNDLKSKVHFVIDDKNKKIAVIDFRESLTGFCVAYEDIIGAEIITDSQVTGGVGRSIVGGVLAGGVGAVVGAVTAKKHIMSYKIVIYTNNISEPKFELILISKKESTNSIIYKRAVEFAENINAVIKVILSRR